MIPRGRLPLSPLATQAFQTRGRFRADPDRFLDPAGRDMVAPDRMLFRRQEVYDLFMKDLHQVFAKARPGEPVAGADALPAIRVRARRPAGGSAGDPLARACRQHRPTGDGLEDDPGPPELRGPLRTRRPLRGGGYRGQIISRLSQVLDQPADVGSRAP